MAVYNYRLANGQTRWFFIIDLPPDANVWGSKTLSLGLSWVSMRLVRTR
ncbi:hypothetical protein [Micromonospora sp. NPDC050200]